MEITIGINSKKCKHDQEYLERMKKSIDKSTDSKKLAKSLIIRGIALTTIGYSWLDNKNQRSEQKKICSEGLIEGQLCNASEILIYMMIFQRLLSLPEENNKE